MPAVILERLASLLARATASLEQEPVAPTKLRECNVLLDEMHGKGLVVGEGLLAATLRKLSTEGVESFDAGDDLVMCNGFMQQHAVLEGKSPCMLASVREPLLRRWKTNLQDDVLGLLLWRAACMAYFIVQEREAAQQLREFLRAGSDSMRVLDRKPAWLVFFLSHPELFDDRPGRVLANQWFAGEGTLAERIREHVELPESSWLWDEMVAEIVRKVEMLSEAAFVPQVINLLKLSKQYPRQRDRIYAVLIDKYARFDNKAVPEPLIDAVIDAWGNPQMERVDAAHRWSNVSEKTRIWMCQLLAEKDLADFFELINKSSKAGLSAMDMRRLQFWMRYTKHMNFTRLVLGDDFFHSSNANVRSYVENPNRQLGRLHGSADNAAFLMRIGDCWCVEFSKTGNAFYGYPAERMPFDPYAPRMIISEMRSQHLCEKRVTHNGSWEEKLADYVDGVILRASGDRFMSPTRVVRANNGAGSRFLSAPKVGLSEEDRFLDVNGVLQKLLPSAQHELRGLLSREVGNRDRMGAYWIELTDSPSIDLIREMKKQGFSYKHRRGFYQ